MSIAGEEVCHGEGEGKGCCRAEQSCDRGPRVPPPSRSRLVCINLVHTVPRQGFVLCLQTARSLLDAAELWQLEAK